MIRAMLGPDLVVARHAIRSRVQELYLIDQYEAARSAGGVKGRGTVLLTDLTMPVGRRYSC